MTARSIAQRNLDAEVRAVTEGHHAFVVNGGAIEVVSDTTPGKRYRVTFRDGGPGGVVFDCRPEHGPNLYKDDHGRRTSREPGLLTCKHAALAARRLERERLIVNVDGVWFVAPDAPASSVIDPFEGFT